jgi:hypothetical protein
VAAFNFNQPNSELLDLDVSIEMRGEFLSEEGMMFDEQDRAYYAQRAITARKHAAEATDAAIRKIHAEMAEEYERRARGEEPRRMLHHPG